MYTTQRGFVALILVLAMTVTMTTWVGLSSSHIFDFMRVERQLKTNSQYSADFLICTDRIIDYEVRLQFINMASEYALEPYEHLDMDIECQVSDRSVTEVLPQEQMLHFKVRIVNHTGFMDVTVSRVRGFITTIKTHLYTP